MSRRYRFASRADAEAEVARLEQRESHLDLLLHDFLRGKNGAEIVRCPGRLWPKALVTRLAGAEGGLVKVYDKDGDSFIGRLDDWADRVARLHLPGFSEDPDGYRELEGFRALVETIKARRRILLDEKRGSIPA